MNRATLFFVWFFCSNPYIYKSSVAFFLFAVGCLPGLSERELFGTVKGKDWEDVQQRVIIATICIVELPQSLRSVEEEKKGEVRAQLERRAEKMSVFNLSRLRDVSTEIKCVLSSLIYWILRLTQQVCCLNFRVMRPSPMACACCRIIQVWGKQGFVRIGQIAWKSLKNSHLTLLFPWLNILIWKAVFLSPWNKTCENLKKFLSSVLFHFHLLSFYLF